MGLRFRKSVKIAPGVRVNFGKKSASVSFGGRGGRVTYSTSGRKTTTVGIPGSGLSYSTTTTKSKAKKPSTSGYQSEAEEEDDTPLEPSFYWKLAKTLKIGNTFGRILAVVLSVMSFVLGFAIPIFFVIPVICIILLIKTRKNWKDKYLAAEEEARVYETVYPEFCKLKEAKDRAKDATLLAEVFMIYEDVAPIAKRAEEKLRGTGFYFSDKPRKDMQEAFEDKILTIMEREYKEEARAINKLKTRKTIDAHIDGFQAMFAGNQDKLSDTQKVALADYTSKLKRIRDMVAPE